MVMMPNGLHRNPSIDECGLVQSLIFKVCLVDKYSKDLVSNPLRIGQHVSQETSLSLVDIKDTNRGPAVFTTLKKIIKNEFGECLQESRRLVYLQRGPEPSSANRIVKRNLKPDFSYSTTPSSICLFRFSALTYNAHMIHYDLDYARNVEGYKNVLVHGYSKLCSLYNLLL